MKTFFKFMTLVSIIMFYSCQSSKFPICTKLSNTKPSKMEGISSTLLKVCNEHNISIDVLSSTVVELRGSFKQMKWIQKNYPILMCDFDQTKVVLDESTYISCMMNAKEWIKIVQSNRAEILMIDETKYCSNCCESK